uniref:Malectin-like domain-containing protein n=1 Tax=Leersia perrieri TaxID=77586 RepID=A0A0D9XCR9_9ORYZ
MALLVRFAVLVVLAAAHGAVGQTGFLSIDCGLELDNTTSTTRGYKDPDEGIFYVADGGYVDGGENHRVAADQEKGHFRSDLTVRSFPSGVRNCYALPTVAGTKYLVRVVAIYGNYDGKNSSSSIQFELHLGVNYWDTVRADGDEVYEAMFVAWAGWLGTGVPRQHRRRHAVLNLRTLGSELYDPALSANKSMCLFDRRNMGSNITIIRYIYINLIPIYEYACNLSVPDDPYDRYWWQMRSDPLWMNKSTGSTIKQNSKFAVPSHVMQTAVEGVSNGTIIKVTRQDKTANKFMIFAHFADFQDSELRRFNVSINDIEPSLQISPPYLSTGTASNTEWYSTKNGMYTITLVATSASKLPPMLNAFEIYTLIPNDNPMTFETN